MNDRSRERVLGAANACEPKDWRQAAIIGAIAAVLCDTGHFLPAQVASVAADRMGWGMSMAVHIDDNLGHPRDDVDLPLAARIFPKRGYPKMSEIIDAVRMFKAQYDPPGQTVAA